MEGKEKEEEEEEANGRRAISRIDVFAFYWNCRSFKRLHNNLSSYLKLSFTLTLVSFALLVRWPLVRPLVSCSFGAVAAAAATAAVAAAAAASFHLAGFSTSSRLRLKPRFPHLINATLAWQAPL